MLKKTKQGENQSNGNEVVAMLQQILDKQGELSGRIEDLEQKTQNHDQTGAALLRMVNLLYDTDDKHIIELTEIPRPMLRPLAYGIMLDALMDEDVQSGKVSLSSVLRNTMLRGMRSFGRKHLAMGLRLAEEQMASEQEKAAEYELGGD